MDYVIIGGWNVGPSEVAEKVRELIAQGYTPCGGLAVAYDPQGEGVIFCAQAMVKQ